MSKGISKKAALYNKSKVGYAGAEGKSMYEITCESLAIDNRPKPEEISHRTWVMQNLDALGIQAAKKKKKTTALPKLNDYKADQIRKVNYKKVNSDSFLMSYEWRKLRMEALKKHGARCQCCGASPATGAVMNVDHIKPRRIFPELALSLDNLQVLCHECNHGKGNWDMTDWRVDKEYLESNNNYFVQLPNI